MIHHVHRFHGVAEMNVLGNRAERKELSTDRRCQDSMNGYGTVGVKLMVHPTLQRLMNNGGVVEISVVKDHDLNGGIRTQVVGITNENLQLFYDSW